jgi:hypothetical protein
MRGNLNPLFTLMSPARRSQASDTNRSGCAPAKNSATKNRPRKSAKKIGQEKSRHAAGFFLLSLGSN